MAERTCNLERPSSEPPTLCLLAGAKSTLVTARNANKARGRASGWKHRPLEEPANQIERLFSSASSADLGFARLPLGSARRRRRRRRRRQAAQIDSGALAALVAAYSRRRRARDHQGGPSANQPRTAPRSTRKQAQEKPNGKTSTHEHDEVHEFGWTQTPTTRLMLPANTH